MRIPSNGLEIEVDLQGPAGGEPLLLIMGLGMQLVAWPDELVADLAGRGFRVIRMDNRDIGLSQHLDHLGRPNLLRASLRHLLGLKVRSAYGLADLAADALGVLDQLGIDKAHVCGASMGGMVAQHLAATQPHRVKSLTLIMTSSGARHLPQARARVRRALLAQPQGDSVEDRVAHAARVWGLIGSPGYPPDPARLRRRLEASIRRAWHPDGVARQLVAIAADGDRSRLLGRNTAPTRVIHGKDDPLVPVPAAHDLVQKIHQAVADIIPGMGHDLPEPLLPRLAAGIAENAARAA
jgi:pimeloyl-ACP methyl ester carboxylesterase